MQGHGDIIWQYFYEDSISKWKVQCASVEWYDYF